MRKALLVLMALCPVAAFAQTAAQQCPTATQPRGTPGAVSSSGWSVSGGKIYLNGKEFIAHGISVANTGDLQQLVTNAQATPLLSTLQNVNYVRIPVFDMSSASEALLQPYIATLTGLGMVVEIGDTNYPGVATGSGLTQALHWYSAMAASTKGNPLVIFSTQNEPNPSAGAGAINTMVSGIYQAIRSAGNNTLIIIGPDSSSNMSISRSTLASMTDVAFTLHFYNWLTNYSTDLGTNEAELAKEIAYMRSFTSADGQMPVVIQEYGDSTDGKNDIDPGGLQTVRAVHNSGLGTVAWAYWNYGMAGDDAVDGSGNLTTYGSMVQQHLTQMASSSSAPVSGGYVSSAFAPQLCALSQAIYPTAVQDAQTAVQQAEEQVQKAQQQLQAVTTPASSTTPGSTSDTVASGPSLAATQTAIPTVSVPSVAIASSPAPAVSAPDQPTVTQADPTSAAAAAIVAEVNSELAGVQAQIQAVEAQITALTTAQPSSAATQTPARPVTAPRATQAPAVVPPPDNSSSGGNDGGDGGSGDAQ